MMLLKLNKNQRDKLQKINPTLDKANCLTEAIGRGGSSSEFLTSVKKKTLILREANIISEYDYTKLTPIECERLQTVPDNYTNHVSDTQRYKMLGNGWTVSVIEYIFKHMKTNVMNVLSLFDGMSCGQIALDRLGIKVDNYFASEIDKYAIQVTKANYPNTKHLGSVVDVKGADLPKIDLLIGGSPCQSFSFAGKMKGMTTKCNQEILTLEDYLKLKNDGFEFQGQSYLFWEYMRLLKECNPTYFLLENVVMAKKWQNVLSQTIGIDPIMINSSLLSAQNRKRLYWTNIGINKANLFGSEQAGIKQPKDKGILLRDVLESEVDAKYNMNMFNDSIKKNIDTIINSINNTKSTCIDGSYYKGFGTRSGKCRQVVKLDKKGKPKKNQDKASCFTAGGNSGGNHSDMDLLLQPNLTIRRLTHVECERLQTVPDNYTNHVSDTQRYKMLGNGWTVSVIEYIFKHMKLNKDAI